MATVSLRRFRAAGKLYMVETMNSHGSPLGRYRAVLMTGRGVQIGRASFGSTPTAAFNRAKNRIFRIAGVRKIAKA